MGGGKDWNKKDDNKKKTQRSGAQKKQARRARKIAKALKHAMRKESDTTTESESETLDPRTPAEHRRHVRRACEASLKALDEICEPLRKKPWTGGQTSDAAPGWQAEGWQAGDWNQASTAEWHGHTGQHGQNWQWQNPASTSSSSWEVPTSSSSWEAHTSSSSWEVPATDSGSGWAGWGSEESHYTIQPQAVPYTQQDGGTHAATPAADDLTNPNGEFDLRKCYVCKHFSYAAKGCIRKDCPSKTQKKSGYKGRGKGSGKSRHVREHATNHGFPPEPPEIPNEPQTQEPSSHGLAPVLPASTPLPTPSINTSVQTLPAIEPTPAIEIDPPFEVVDVADVAGVQDGANGTQAAGNTGGPMVVDGALPKAASPAHAASPKKWGFNCLICLHDCPHRACFLPCAHGPFHSECLHNYLMYHTTCPICRLSMSDPLAEGHLIRNVQLVTGEAAIDMVQALPMPAAKAAPIAPSGAITVPDDEFELLDAGPMEVLAGSSTDFVISAAGSSTDVAISAAGSSTDVAISAAGSLTNTVTSAAPANGDGAATSPDGNDAASPNGNGSEKGDGKGKDKGDGKGGNWRKRFKQSPPE